VKGDGRIGRGSRSRALFALLVAALTAAALTGSARAAQVGVEPDLNWGITQAEQDRTAGVLADSGAGWVRLTVQWKYWEPTGPSVALPVTGSLSDTDRSVQLARNAGAKVIIDVYNAPDWAAAATSSEGQVPKNASDFANFMRNLAAHYKGQVAAYEIWNEEDLTRFWAGGTDPVKYTSLLNAAYPAIKSADPAATVVFGGLSWDFKSQTSFLKRAYDAGAKASFDVLGIHPYPDSDTDPNLVKWQTWYTAAHNLMAQYGDGGKQIWFTEFGFNTSTATVAGGAWQAGVSELAQASMLTSAFQILQSVPYVGVVIVYNLRNNYWGHDNPTSVEDNFGLLHTDFSPKPAYSAFKDIAHGVLAPAPVPAPAPAPATSVGPANDAFSAAQTLTDVTGAVSTSSENATKEAGEPAHAGKTGGRSIWFKWTAPTSGTVTMDTFGSAFDTVLAVYTGSSVSTLTAIASNDDSGGIQSKVAFAATAGTVYRIAVDGWSGGLPQSGAVKLNWTGPPAGPANDAFSAAQALTGTSGTLTTSSNGATKEAGEPAHAGKTGGRSIWFTFTSPTGRTVTLDTFGSSFDTVLAVYNGTSVSGLTAVASNDDSGGIQSKVSFSAVAGTVYRVAVDGWSGGAAQSGTVKLNWR
jgi:hypothetical protein